MATNFIAFNECNESLHTFVRAGEDIEAIHVDGSVCKAAEFNIEELVENDLPTLYTCPGCNRPTLNDDGHIRGCIGYQPSLSQAEIVDAYSGPTERAKRDAMLRDK